MRLVGLDRAVPDFSTLPRRQKTMAANIPYRGSKGPLHLLIDNEALSAVASRTMPSGIKVEGDGEWHARKHGGPKRRVWRKIHLGIDEETLEIRAVEITGSHIGDAPVLPDLPSQIPLGEEIGSVTADGAYDTRKCHDAIAERRAYAVIPPRKNAKPWKTITAGALAIVLGPMADKARRETTPCARPNTLAVRSGDDGEGPARHRFEGGRERYHRRSRVETKMRCVKLLGQRLMARDFDRQVAELQVRIAVLNGCTALGIPVTEPAGYVRPGKGEPWPSADSCNTASMPQRCSWRKQVRCLRLGDAGMQVNAKDVLHRSEKNLVSPLPSQVARQVLARHRFRYDSGWASSSESGRSS